MDSAEDIAVDVLTRLPKVNSLRDAFIAIGYGNLYGASRDIWLPYGWENFPENKKVAALTKAIEKAMKVVERSKRSSDMKEAAGILEVAKEVLSGHKTEHSKAWLQKEYPQFNKPAAPKKTPATQKPPDEARRKQWREDAAKRRKEEGIQPRKTT